MTDNAAHGRAYYLAFRDLGSQMVPASQDGEILLFASYLDAQGRAGALGSVAYVPLEQIYRYAARHALEVPTNGQQMAFWVERGDAMGIKGGSG